MRPNDDSQTPVVTGSRDLTADSKDDMNEPPILPPTSSAPFDGIGSPEGGPVVENTAPREAEEPAVSHGTDSNHALEAHAPSAPSEPLEESQPEETAMSVTGARSDETSQAVLESLAKEDGKAVFNEPEQPNGAEQDLFSQPVLEEPSAGLAVYEQIQALESHDNGAQVDSHEGNEQSATANGKASSATGGFWDNATDDGADGGEDFFNQLKTQTKPIYSPPDPDARFEEGIPLLNETSEAPVEAPTDAPAQPTEAAKPETQIDNIFAGDEDEGDDFFSQVQKGEPERELAPHLTRKNTTQVMDSVGEVPDSPVGDASPSVQDFNALLAPPSSKQVNKSSSEEDLAARWQAELSDNEEKQEPTEEDLAARWQAELDDDDLLMDDDASGSLPAGHAQSTQSSELNFAPAGVNGQNFGTQTAASTAYTPHQPPTLDLLQGMPVPKPPASAYFAPPPPRPETIRAESFAERSKEGYKSPYDVPENLARPRRPAKPVITAGPPSTASNVPPAGSMPTPPRSSSIPAPPPAASPVPPPPTSVSPPVGALPPAQPAAAQKNFYEDLPLPPPRPRSRPASSGRYTPSRTTTAPAGLSQPPPPPNPYAPSPQPSQRPQFSQPPEPQTQPQLQPPERLDPLANSLAPPPPTPPSASSRYSPKPPGMQGDTKPPPSPRYSPAPPPTSGPPRNRYVAQPPSTPGQGLTLPFQPRTSSPLAYHEKVSYQPSEPERRPSLEPAANLSPPNRFQPRPSLEQNPIPGPGDAVDSEVPKAETRQGVPPPTTRQMSPPRNIYAPPSYVDEFASRLPTANNGPSPFPVIETPDEDNSQFLPPRRSQTQSPSQQMAGPKLSIPSVDPFQRPASVHGSGSPTKPSPYAPAQVSARSRAPSLPLHFIPPSDEQQTDPLERWKGAPIVTFGFGGAITSCFPRHIPRYAAGQAAPMIKSCPGEVKICQLNDWIPPAEGIVAHPGPLKNKSKKKDVVSWLASKTAEFENEGLPQGAELDPDAYKRHDEKILLWKIVRVLVENDGALEGSAEVQKSLREVIFPQLQNGQYGDGFSGQNNFQPQNAPAQPDAIDSRLIDSLRDNLILGDREKAVWGAVDNRLWGHAMIIASTVDKSVWKQVVQEFVRREVRSATGNTESLAALYEIFAGNVEESIDELVPPSARAGLQMVSKVNGQESSKNTLDGLDSWRDTLGMVLSNRSPEDYQALLALGRLLLSYGRVEAAHICMIFSHAAVFGGVDDPQASIVLLGANHQHFPSTFMHDEDAILLTEVYEFATCILASLPQASLPHMMGFKMLHAWTLAERGRKSEALQYCDGIAAALKATTRPSGYFHQHLFAAVDELSARLRQTTGDGGSSWISRPSMEKVSGSMWARFNSFVSGEDDDAASTGSGKPQDADIGPFAKVTGTPTVSRSPSMSDLYSSYPAAGGQPIPGPPSRYHPSNQYAPNSSPEQFRGRSSLDSQRSFGFGRRGSQEPATPSESNYYPGGSTFNSPLVGYQSTPPQTSYMPLAPVEEDLPAQTPPQPTSAPMQASSISGSPYQPSYQPSNQPSMYTSDAYAQPFGDQGVNQADGFGYMPPSTGYGPPVEETGAMQEVVEEEQSKPFMDDDNDIAARQEAEQKAEKERQDRETAEAFRKAAEEDGNSTSTAVLHSMLTKTAKKPPAPSKKSSWFGSWFSGGSKKEPDTSNPNKPIRAKLGEENSFYYDTELKKWVNKKDPNSATTATPPPPPPKRMGPPSTSSNIPPAASTPPMASSASTGSRPSSSGAPPFISGSPAPPSTLGVPPPLPRSISTGVAAPTPSAASSAPGPALGPPPPRPATSLSNASSIDDLLGAPTARKGGAGGRGKKKGRYVDVMAQ